MHALLPARRQVRLGARRHPQRVRPSSSPPSWAFHLTLHRQPYTLARHPHAPLLRRRLLRYLHHVDYAGREDREDALDTRERRKRDISGKSLSIHFFALALSCRRSLRCTTS